MLALLPAFGKPADAKFITSRPPCQCPAALFKKSELADFDRLSVKISHFSPWKTVERIDNFHNFYKLTPVSQLV
jgi:hypothetical protein